LFEWDRPSLHFRAKNVRNSNTSSNKSVVVGALCLQFIQEWKRGEKPDIHDYLVDLDEQSRRAVFAELLNIEIEMRREKGESPLPKDYLQRFPANQPTIVAAFDAMSATMTDSRVSITGGTLVGSGGDTGTSSELSVGQWLGKYEITSMLGKGGMGVVYSARDSLIRREVAIKQLGSRHAKNETALMRLLQEARTAGSLQHANIVSIYDVIEHGESLYLVMEKVTGENLGEILLKSPAGRLDWQTATRLVIDCCDALEAAHAQSLIHRDIKPQNIMVTSCQRAKVLDFGLAKSEELNENTAKTEAGTVLGTPDFMSPEQFHGENVDARSDLYSLGATYFALLAGEAPFAYAGGHLKVMYAHANAPIPRVTDRVPEIPAGCDAVINRAMAKEPNKRYASAAEFKASLESLLKQDGKAATGAFVKASGKKLLFGLTGVVVACLAMIAVAWILWPKSPNSNGVAAEPAVVPEATAAIVPPPSAAKGSLFFGTTTAFSGSNRDLGQNVALGIRTSFAAVNEQGGVHGRKLELVVLDDAYDPDRALANMKELVEVRKVFGVIGNVGTPTARVTVPFAIEHHVLFFAPYSGAGLLRQDPPDRYVFNYRASYADETAAMVRYFVEIKRIDPKKVAVFAQTDSYGDDGFHGVARAMRKYNIREEDILRVGYLRNTVNVDEAVAEILKRGDQVDAVIMVPAYKPAARFIQKVRQQRGEMQFGIVSFVGSVSLAHEFEEMGMETGEGVIVTQVVPHFMSNSTGVLRYRKLLHKFSPEQQPGFISLEGFIAAECLVEGLKKAGPDPTTDAIVDALESIQNLDLGIGPIIQFGPSRHQASNKVWGTRLLKNGEFEVLDLE
jgi:ABC-type branched-subunit amino acid transport system substrate-binding protein